MRRPALSLPTSPGSPRPDRLKPRVDHVLSGRPDEVITGLWRVPWPSPTPGSQLPRSSAKERIGREIAGVTHRGEQIVAQAQQQRGPLARRAVARRREHGDQRRRLGRVQIAGADAEPPARSGFEAAYRSPERHVVAVDLEDPLLRQHPLQLASPEGLFDLEAERPRPGITG